MAPSQPTLWEDEKDVALLGNMATEPEFDDSSDVPPEFSSSLEASDAEAVPASDGL